MKQRQLKCQQRRKRKAEIVSVFSKVLSLVKLSCPQIWNYRARERQRKRESRRQASEAQQDKGRQRSRVRDEKQRRHFLLEEQQDNFVAVVTK